MKNQNKFLAKFANEFDEKFDYREGEMATQEFMEWMRSQFAAYDKAIEKDVRAMSRDEFKSKWLEKRMDVKETFLPDEDSNVTNKSLNDGKRQIVWVIDEMLADFDCIVEDDHSDKIADMHHWIDARMSEAQDSFAPYAPVKVRLLRSFRESFNALFG